MTEAIDDPYRVLGLARDATDEEIRGAYERRLADAAAAGALRTAQQVDAAFTVLRDPRRRAMFDREGRIVDLPRFVPDERWAQPQAVPFRSWSPPDRPRRRRIGRVHREGLRTTLILVLVATVVGFGLKFGLVGRTQGPALRSDVWHAPSTAAAGLPPLHHGSHRARLLPPATAPAESGPFAFEMPGSEGPVRWDPCEPVRYVISGNEPFAGAGALLASAINEVSAATGLQFVYAGTSTESPTEHRAPYQPARYGKHWAPVLIAWTDASVVPRLAGTVVGIGGGASATLAGVPRVVSGIVALDGPDLARIKQRADGSVEARAVMLHELGHLVGLAHVKDPAEIMNPTAAPLEHFAVGDRRGLATLGAGPCPSDY